jgi:filamentous hemagglutinin family protein
MAVAWSGLEASIRGSSGSRSPRAFAISLIGVATIAVALLAATPARSQTLPNGGSVTSGSANIVQPNATTLNINQSTNQAIINWNTFSVGRGDTVNFNQPGSSSSTLNRVTSSTPSWIAGTINAPGTVLLINPNGIEITKSGVINTGSFAASTLNIKDSDYLSGHYNFFGNGGSAGVINNGRINVSDGGFAALLGGQATNNGVIAARLGFVALGAGEQATLDLSGDGFLSVTIPSSELGHLVSANGALVSNKGKILANGGTVFLTAATAQNILRNAVNMGGLIRANSVGTHDGRIAINGGGGNVNVTGKLLAESRSGQGGEIDITSSANVTVLGALIDASGATGGTIRIISGGNLAADATIAALGTDPGNSGGTIETSGQTVQIGGQIDAGQGGSWLLDPNDLTIDSTLATTIDTALDAGTNVTEQTTLSGSGGNGDIFVTSALTWTTGASLTLSAYRNVDVEANITSTGGGAVTLYADNTGTGTGTVAFTAGDKVSTSGGTGPATVAIYYNPTGSSTSVNATKYTAASQTSYSGDVSHGTLTTYMLVNTVYDLQNITNNLSGASAVYALGTNIDASVTSGWNSGQGFVPIGAGHTFLGTLNGQGYSISNLFIDQTSTTYVGLFGIAQGTITDFNLVNANITGGAFPAITGGVAAENFGTISLVTISGSVSGGGEGVGGLVGINFAGAGDLITETSSSATVKDTGASGVNFYTGGLVGENSGTISLSFATGPVSGYSDVGGLVGFQLNGSGSITNAYATGNVSGNTNVGGLLGYMGGGTIAETYAVGSVSGTTLFGGLVGRRDSGTAQNSYWDNSVNSAGVGGTGSTSGIFSQSTLQLQAGLPSGFSNTVWGIIPGVTFPYLLWSPALAISGTDYTTFGGTPVAGATVSDIINGVAGATTATTNGSGNYTLVLLPGTFAASNQIVVYTNSGISYDQNASGSVSGLNIYGTYLSETTSGTTLSGLASGYAAATAGHSGLLPTVANLVINAAGSSFAIDQAVNTGTFVLSTTGTVTQSAAITATDLDLLGSGGTYTLTGPTTGSNSVGTLAANTGTVDFNDGASLTVGTVDGTAGITGSGPITLIATGNLTIASGADVAAGASDNVVLSATGNFINDQGSNAVTVSGSGRWLIYSNTPTNDTFGPGGSATYLNSNNNAIWDSTIATLPPGSVGGSGDTYIFALQPTLTFTSTNLTKTYGVNDSAAVASAYSVAGYQGVSGAFLTDTAANTYTGTPAVTSSGSATTANVAGSPYTIAIAQGTVNSIDGYALSFVSSGQLTVNTATITLTGFKTYDSTTTFGANDFGINGTIFTGVGLQTLTVTGSGSVGSPNVITGVQTLNTGTLALANGTGIFGGLASNYTIAITGNSGIVIPATIFLAGTKIYNGNKVFTAADFGTDGTINTGINNETLNVTGSGSVPSANVSAGTQFLSPIGLGLANGTGLASNYQIAFIGNTGRIDPATLTYVANPETMNAGASVPALTGTVQGTLYGTDTLTNAFTGTLVWTTTATSSSPAGSYPIDGSGLKANHGNYVFVQAAANATALTIDPAGSGNPPSQYVGPTNGNTPNPTTINFTNPGANLVHVAFTPNGTNTANNGNDVSPGSLPPGDAFMHNHGFDFPPISEYDSNQYSDFKLPGYDNDDGEATILTILARGVSPGHGGDYMIDGFWNGDDNTWPGSSHIGLFDKLTFSDGAGHDVTPTNDNAFPIVAGKTDFAALLKNGPVMIGGAPGQTPAEWLLALNIAPDGKGIICDDPITGKLVELAYDQATETLGGITGVFDPKSKGFIALADASGDIPAGAADGLAALQGFVPSTYYAVTVH